MSHQHPVFQIEAAYDLNDYVVRVQGELDLATCPELERALAEAETTEAPRISLNLEQLTFIDSSGLNLLLTAGRRSAANGDRLRITHGNGQVAKMFQITGLEAMLPFERALV